MTAEDWKSFWNVRFSLNGPSHTSSLQKHFLESLSYNLLNNKEIHSSNMFKISLFNLISCEEEEEVCGTGPCV